MDIVEREFEITDAIDSFYSDVVELIKEKDGRIAALEEEIEELKGEIAELQENQE